MFHCTSALSDWNRIIEFIIFTSNLGSRFFTHSNFLVLGGSSWRFWKVQVSGAPLFARDTWTFVSVQSINVLVLRSQWWWLHEWFSEHIAFNWKDIYLEAIQTIYSEENNGEKRPTVVVKAALSSVQAIHRVWSLCQKHHGFPLEHKYKSTGLHQMQLEHPIITSTGSNCDLLSKVIGTASGPEKPHLILEMKLYTIS